MARRLSRILTVMALDALSIFASFYFALLIYYDFNFSDIPATERKFFFVFVCGFLAFSVLMFFLFRLYHIVWHYIGIDEAFRVMLCYFLLAILLIGVYLISPIRLSLSFYTTGFLFSFFCTLGLRFFYRFAEWLKGIASKYAEGDRERIMIIGAGAAGQVLIHEIRNDQHVHARVVCAIDDNPIKKNQHLEGVLIVGGRDQIVSAAKEYRVQKIVYAIPSGDMRTRKEILEICNQTGCKVQVVPGLYQLVAGTVMVDQLRDVDVQDLLGREPVQVNLAEIRRYFEGQTILVTGGGGSIGSELCRQIAACNPRRLVILDIYENNAYTIQLELRRKYPQLNLEVLIGSVRDTARVNSLMEQYHPDIVFHAAAHKHVPLMEDSPNEAIKNNVFGTYKMAQAASRHGVRKFVLISTDKAVNPTNIMGASKRLCEMVIQMMDRESSTEFVAVRFGNVLGSNGSVIPLFKEQIARGGPVTVTDPEITRFFMTIPEAVSLVLQANCYAHGGEIFVLDMGQPVKIADMAKNLIRLSGFEPDVDIPIQYIGLRPGEKLYEELLMEEEGLRETPNNLIHIGRPIEMDDALFKEQLIRLQQACKGETDQAKQMVAEMVPTYHCSETERIAVSV